MHRIARRYVVVGTRVGRELDAVIARRGCPTMIVSDNGTELTSMAILRWSQLTRIEWYYIAPGKPAECLRGKLQWATARRVVERDIVLVTRACSRAGASRQNTLPTCQPAKPCMKRIMPNEFSRYQARLAREKQLSKENPIRADFLLNHLKTRSKLIRCS